MKNKMSIAMANLAITEGTCYGCRFWESVPKCASKKDAPCGACEQHKIDAAKIISFHLAQQLKEAKAAAVENAHSLKFMCSVIEANKTEKSNGNNLAAATLKKFRGE